MTKPYTEKMCPGCVVVKPRSSFAKISNFNREDRLSTKCRTCTDKIRNSSAPRGSKSYKANPFDAAAYLQFVRKPTVRHVAR